MVGGEIPRSENLEALDNPEQVADNALSTIEIRDAVDPVISSDWARNCRDWIKENREQAGQKYTEWAQEHKKTVASGKFALDITRIGIAVAAKMVWGILRFAYEAIKNKGRVPSAYKIGKEIFSFDGKDKK